MQDIDSDEVAGQPLMIEMEDEYRQHRQGAQPWRYWSAGMG